MRNVHGSATKVVVPRHANRSTRHRNRSRGQTLVEFALVAPVLLLILAGIIQFGMIFWGQNTLNQIARDTGRWAASQQQCTDPAPIVKTANDIARGTALLGYSSWASVPDAGTAYGVEVQWEACPPVPKDNTETAWVTISIRHHVPIFFPWVPGNGDIWTSTQFRIEPAP